MGFLDAIGAIATPVTNLVGSILNYKGAKETNAATIENSKELQQDSQDYNTWLMQNQSQMKIQDLKSAGLSPSFANGSVSASTTSPTGTSGVSLQNPYAGFQGLGSDASSAILALANARKANADAKLVEETADDQKRKAKGDANRAEAEGDIRKIDAVYHPERLVVELNKLASDAQLSGYQADNLRIVNDWLPKLKEKELDSLAATINEIKQRTANFKELTAINKVAAEIAEKYGILPTDDGFKALIHLIASDKAGKVITQLLKALKDAGASAFHGLLDSIGLD